MTDPRIDIRVTLDAARFAALWARAPQIVLRELAAGLTSSAMLLEREVKERTPTSGAGTLRDSIGAMPIEISGTRLTTGVATSLSYAAPVEDGSRPHMPPIEPLAEWVRRRLGIADDADAEDVAWRIAWKIRAHGTEAAHMFQDAFAEHAGQVERILERSLDRAAARIGAGA